MAAAAAGLALLPRSVKDRALLAMADALDASCVDLTGKNYRTYSLQWKTTWFGSLEPPHWLCTDRRDNELKDYNLGWWVDL